MPDPRGPDRTLARRGRTLSDQFEPGVEVAQHRRLLDHAHAPEGFRLPEQPEETSATNSRWVPV